MEGSGGVEIPRHRLAAGLPKIVNTLERKAILNDIATVRCRFRLRYIRIIRSLNLLKRGRRRMYFKLARVLLDGMMKDFLLVRVLDLKLHDYDEQARLRMIKWRARR